MLIEFQYHSAYGVWLNALRSPSSRASVNGSLPVGAKAGTEPTVQWEKIPNLASRNHFGTGWVDNDSNVGWYIRTL